METTPDRIRDEWLALRCQLGESGAFAELVREMERPLLYYATKLLGDDHTALDVLQEVWIAVLREFAGSTTRARCDPGSTGSPAAARSTGSGATARAAWPSGHGPGRFLRKLARNRRSTTKTPPRSHRALDELDLKHRDVLVLHFLEDLSIAEIAAIVGGPAGTVKSRIFHASEP